MIHQRPKQEETIEKSNWPTIRSAYKEFEVTFVMLHPFLKIKPDCEVNFETGNWPTKWQIIACTERLSWAEVVHKAGLKDISELDRLLAYLHCARRTADKDAWIKLRSTLHKNNYIAAEVDYLPAILINDLMNAIKSLGYSKIIEYTEFGEFRKEHTVDDVLASKERNFHVHARLATPDNKLVIASGFDLRFTYLSGSKEIINCLINDVNIEGFFCNEVTQDDWSYIDQTENLIDWRSPERNKNYG